MNQFVPYESKNFPYFCYHMQRIWAKALCDNWNGDWEPIRKR